jgi:hypothetical protein
VLLEDRVITTDRLLSANDGSSGWLQLGPGILEQLDPLGFHVLVPSGHLHMADDENDVMTCIAELQAGSPDPIKVRVLMPRDLYLALPRAFDVLARIPAVASGMVTDLEVWMTETATGEADDAAA